MATHTDNTAASDLFCRQLDRVVQRGHLDQLDRFVELADRYPECHAIATQYVKLAVAVLSQYPPSANLMAWHAVLHLQQACSATIQAMIGDRYWLSETEEQYK